VRGLEILCSSSQNQTHPIVMVHPRPGRGWGREGFGARRGGQGGG
jgi:hypothetical protein